jgi:7-cyano-7-deazaguanine synthase
MTKKAIVLLSGGLDSTTTLYYAISKGYECHALILDYGQRHKKEIKIAKKIASLAKVPCKVLKISLPWKGSSLLDKSVKLPDRKLSSIKNEIPSTYVPARNTIFLSFALSYAEAVGAKNIFIGANAIDYSGYPDCRPNYFKAFNKMAVLGTKARKIKVLTPLINMLKSDIIRLGMKLEAPLHLTWSCYKGGEKPCGVCDSCRLRMKGFDELGT